MLLQIPFSKKDFISVGDVKELGSIEETVWNMKFSFEFGTGIFRGVYIIRSRSNGGVKIELMLFGRRNHIIQPTLEFFLLDGVRRAFFALDGYLWSTNFSGYVTIHYNSVDSLNSKVEAVTQTENDIMSSTTNETIPSPQLANNIDLLHILNNPDSFSDATLVCGKSKIPVHRNILSARSPVFAAMFKTQMQEGRDGVVDIVDMEPDVLRAMLRYVYSGQTHHLTDSLAGDLLFAADKYQLEELKLFCVWKLKSDMAENNVFTALVLGDLHDKSLKAIAVKFICEHKKFSDLEKTKEWQTLMKERPSLALEVLTTVVKQAQEKLNLFQELKP